MTEEHKEPELQPEDTPVPVASKEESTTNPETEVAEEEKDSGIVRTPVPEQSLGELSDELSTANEKNPSELYRTMLLTGMAIPQSTVYDHSVTWPNAKIVNGEEIFASEKDEEFIDSIRGAYSHYTPNNIGVGALSRPDSEWSNSITDESISPIRPKSHRKSGTTATALLSRITNTGAPVTLPMFYTGIYVTFTAPTESDYCDYDILQAMETLNLGMESFGLQLSASSGVYLRHMVEFCLRFATATTYDTEGGDIAQALINVLDERDYISVLMGPTLAKFPGGIPWEIVCPDANCQHVEHMSMNVARAIRYDNNALNRDQKQFFSDRKALNSVSDEEVAKYREGFRRPLTSIKTIEFDDNLVNIHLRHGTLGNYLTRSAEWAREINESTTEALSDFATEHQRNAHLRTRAETRRLTRYSHRVEKIEVVVDPNGEDIRVMEEDEGEILKLLVQLSANPKVVGEFEEHLDKFNDDTTYTMLAFMSRPCGSCGTRPETKDKGPFRGLVPISPDRVFFGLSQAISSTQIALRDIYEARG